MLDFFKKKKKEEKPKVKRGFFRELANDILFALIAVTIIRGLFIEAYAIPTGSMENSMLIGDHLFVSKLHYGARTPKTLIQFPLAHQKFWGTDIPSYSDIIQLPVFRLPGFRSVRRGEPVVFNYPPDLDYPLDIKTFYVKRCVAIPGDTFKIVNKQVFINGVASENPPNLQTSFFVETDKGVHLRFMQEYGITDYEPKDPRTGNAEVRRGIHNGKTGFFMYADTERAENLRGLNSVKSIEEIVYDEFSNDNAFPESQNYLGNQHTSYDPITEFNWTRDNFGELVMPAKGMTIELTQRNIDLYRTIIEHYEGNDEVEIKEDEIWIEGQKLTEYTFNQGYYFMVGDNRHNSADSRFWGFVPADHIVGKPLFIFWSVDSTDPNAGFFSRIRFNRFLDLIN